MGNKNMYDLLTILRNNGVSFVERGTIYSVAKRYYGDEEFSFSLQADSVRIEGRVPYLLTKEMHELGLPIAPTPITYYNPKTKQNLSLEDCVESYDFFKARENIVVSSVVCGVPAGKIVSEVALLIEEKRQEALAEPESLFIGIHNTNNPASLEFLLSGLEAHYASKKEKVRK